MSVVRHVWGHELRDALRDRRMVTVALVSAFLPAVLNIVMEGAMRRQVQERREAALVVAVSHRERAPNLLEWLESQEVQLIDAPPDAEQALRDRRLDVMLEIDEHYAEAWREGRPAKVTLAYDQTQLSVLQSAQRLRSLLIGYGREVGALRLVLQGVAPETAHAVVVGERDVAPASSGDPLGNAMLPFLLLLGSLVGAGMLAVDLTAGERERQSIESLLVTAAKRDHIMLGKILASSSYGSMILVTQAALILLTAGAVKSESYRLDLHAVGPLLLTLLPLVALVATVLTGMSAFSKTVREAQSAMSMVMLLPIAPMFYLLAAQPKPTLALYATPLLGQFQLASDILRGDQLPPLHLILNLAVTLAVLAVTMWFCSRLYRREGLAISA